MAKFEALSEAEKAEPENQGDLEQYTDEVVGLFER